MCEFEDGTYEFYVLNGISEDGKFDLVLVTVFFIENDTISYPDGIGSDILPKGPINFCTGLRLRRFLNDGHGYCLVVLKSA